MTRGRWCTGRGTVTGRGVRRSSAGCTRARWSGRNPALGTRDAGRMDPLNLQGARKGEADAGSSRRSRRRPGTSGSARSGTGTWPRTPAARRCDDLLGVAVRDVDRTWTEFSALAAESVDGIDVSPMACTQLSATFAGRSVSRASGDVPLGIRGSEVRLAEALHGLRDRRCCDRLPQRRVRGTARSGRGTGATITASCTWAGTPM
jgi:hypothetical protein